MPTNKKYNIEEDLLDKIVLTAYGDADPKVSKEVFELIEKNESAKKAYYDFKRTAHQVKQIKTENCPDYLIKKVEEKIHFKKIEKNSLTQNLIFSFFSNPAKSFLVSAMLIAIVVFGIFFGEQKQQNFDYAQARQAEFQAKDALAKVGNILNKTQSVLINDIIPQKVSEPFNESFKVINNLIKSGDKNEDLN